MSFLSRFKKSIVTGAVAATILSGAFSFLQRDCINFGKIEGDQRIIRDVKNGQKDFRNSLNRLSKLKQIRTKDIEEVTKTINLIRGWIKESENRKISSQVYFSAGDYLNAKKELIAARQIISDTLKNKVTYSWPLFSDLNLTISVRQILESILEDLDNDLLIIQKKK